MVGDPFLYAAVPSGEANPKHRRSTSSNLVLDSRLTALSASLVWLTLEALQLQEAFLLVAARSWQRLQVLVIMSWLGGVEGYRSETRAIPLALAG
jgi:hypothetical protein